MMKNFVFAYHLFISLYGIGYGIYSLLYTNFIKEPLKWIFIGIIIIFFSFHWLISAKRKIVSIWALFLFNSLQVIVISVFKFSYKFLYGTELFIFYHNLRDSIVRTQFRLWYFQIDIDVMESSGLFFIGVNILQLGFAFYFLKLILFRKKLLS